MVNYYGIGTWWGSSRPHQKFDEFINEGKACIHALPNKPTPRENNNRIRFQNIFKTIREKDFIYLKSFNRRGHLLKIRAVGKVIKIDKTRENEGIFCVKVDYKPNHDFDGMIQDEHFDDNFPGRGERVCHETNQEVIRIINELLQE